MSREMEKSEVDDPELQAIASCYGVLSSFDTEAMGRILGWLITRLKSDENTKSGEELSKKMNGEQPCGNLIGHTSRIFLSARYFRLVVQANIKRPEMRPTDGRWKNDGL